MRTTIYATIAILTAVASDVPAAAEKSDPAARAAVVAPFMDATTYGVMHVDLTRVKAGPAIDLLARIIPNLGPERGEVEQKLSRLLDTYSAAGCKEAYFTINLAQLGPDVPGYVILPLGDNADVEALMEFAPRPSRGGSADDVSKRVGNVLVLGGPNMMARLDSLQPEERPALEKAFEAAGDTVAQLLIVPPAHVGKVLEAMMPTLPEQIGGGSTEVFTRGIKWAAVGVNSPPDTSVRLVIQSEDAQVAGALREKIADILRRISRHEAVKELLPKLAGTTEILVPQVRGDRLTLVLDEENGNLGALLSMIALPVTKARSAATGSRSANNLKQLGIAMQNYHNVYKRFPGSASFDSDGNPLLSWRVQILPYIEQQKLYEQFHLDEPWDSEHNRKLIEKMPKHYRSPASKLKKEGRASYLRPTGQATVCPSGPGITFKEIKDGTSNTIMIVEVDDDRTVIWTKPGDLPIDMDNPADGLGGLYEGSFWAAICDGSVNSFKASAPADALRGLFTRAGRERIDWDQVRK